MKFLVVGHLCLDVIHPADGNEFSSYGGIYYAVAALAALLNNGDRVIPVFGVNKDDYQPFLQHLKRFPNVDTSGIFQFEEPTNNVHLFYKDRESRIECSKDISRPIPFARIKEYLKVDGILVNMISGFDITLDTMDEIRMAVREKKVPIHFDYHSLTLGVKADHQRFRRPVENWRRWAFMTDTVQLNEEEVAGLTLEESTEQQTIGHMLTLGGKGVVVTRGERGASLFYNEHKKVVRKDVEGVKLDRQRDATGCGDVFGAAFLMHAVKWKDLPAAAEFANRVAGAKARMAGSDTIHSLRELVPS